VVLIAIALLVWTQRFRDGRDPDNVMISGNIEVTQVDLGFKIPGRLAERAVDEGGRVAAGQLVGRLDDSDYALQEKKAAADLEYARAVLAELLAGSRPQEKARAAGRVEQMRQALLDLEKGSRTQEVAGAFADLERAMAGEEAAQSRLVLARADFDRYSAVHDQGGISDQAFQSQLTRLETTQSALREAAAAARAAGERLSLVEEGPRNEKIRQARAALDQARAEYELVAEGPRPETIAQARARVTAAEQGLALARQTLADTRLHSPMNGLVLSKSAEPGAWLAPGSPVVTVARTDRVWVRAFVSETDLGRLTPGSEAEVVTDAFPDRTWTGRLGYIAGEAEFTPKAVQTFEERVNLMYRIKVDVDNPDGLLKPGMPADIRIPVKP
ncbi:MAG: efflux RND transporter periplasmic adaptor subunit, partial [Pseudomonadota bacterium]